MLRFAATGVSRRWSPGSQEVRRLHAGLPKNVLLVLDAAYAEYVRRNDYEAGIELAGFVGALFAIPVGAALNAVAQEVIEERRRRVIETPPDLSTPKVA